jgi:3-hydroxyisobutyrate dehydrogenase-like beta-hydroxyacid dehydrogenase
MTDLPRLGFIGLGSMGGAMAARLLAQGYPVTVFDTSPAAVAGAERDGGRAAADVASLSRSSDLVLMSLPTPDIVRRVALGEGGVRDAGGAKLLLDLSTTGPRISAEAAEGLRPAGIEFVDAPVSGGRNGVIKGTLSIMASCSTPAWEQSRPVLEAMGKVFRVGDKPGQAQVMKLVNNLLSVVALVATSEGMAMGVKAGLDPAVMLEVINASSGRNSATTDKFPRAVLTRTFDFGFATGLSLKDVRLALDEAEAMGVPMMVCATARTMLSITQAEFGSGSDFTTIAKVVEQWAGVEIGAASDT